MTRSRFTTLLTATALGTYLLLALGATAAETGAGIATGLHHTVAVVVGFAIVGLAILAATTSHPQRVWLPIAVATVAYPFQAGLGLLGMTGGIHLAGGLFVLGTLVFALVWHLDDEHNTEVPIHAGSDGTSAEDPNTVVVDAPTTVISDAPTTPVADAPTTATAGAGGAAFLGETEQPAEDRPLPEKQGFPDRVVGRMRAYVELTKPRLMWLLCLLALAGMTLGAAGPGTLNGVVVVATLAGGVMAIGAAGTFNHVYERDRDQQMTRTSDRPVAASAISPVRATTFGVVLAVASMVLLVTLVNPLTAVLTACAIIYYAVVYTVLLKPSTPWNTVIGGGSGALPALIGWAAVTGGIGLPALLLAAVVFCWTPAHFYNFAIANRDDYDRADYPMLPVVKGVATTRRRTTQWLGATLAVSALLAIVAGFGPLYAVMTTLAGGVFAFSLVDQFKQGTDQSAFRTFYASNAYLGALLLAVVIESVVI